MLSALTLRIDLRHSWKLPQTTRSSQAHPGKLWDAQTLGITERKLLWDAQTLGITQRKLLWDAQTLGITERKLLWDAKMAQEPPKSENIENCLADLPQTTDADLT